MELKQTISPAVEVVPTIYPPTVSIPSPARNEADLGFITDYANYVDVVEAPRIMHEMVATQFIASILNRNGVTFRNGPMRHSMDMWVVLLSGSGAGRSTLVRLGDDVWQAAGVDNLVRSADWGSGMALYQDLAEHPTGLFVWGELSERLQKFNSANFTSIKPWFTDRYDNFAIPEARRYRKTGKSNDTPDIVFSTAPRMNILATSSLDWFFSNLAQTDSTGGFIPRWILVQSDGIGRSVPIPPPLDASRVPYLAEQLQRIGALKGEADISAILHLYSQWYNAARERFYRQPNRALAAVYFNRLRGHILKLSIIYEASSSYTLIVTPESWNKAVVMARKLENTIFKLLDTGMNATGYALQKMEDRIRQAGKSGMSQSELTRAFQSEPLQERERWLKTLLDAGRVIPTYKVTSGRTATVYTHQDHTFQAEEEPLAA